MSLDELSQTRLVGGTALALQLGHRFSVDIDMFGEVDPFFTFDGILVKDIIPLKRSRNINVYDLGGIKVEIVNYRYPWLEPPVTHGKIRMASLADIGAMKLNAITGRGSRKDFVDLFFLLEIFTLNELFDFYTRKFDDGNLFLVKKGLAYFADAEVQLMPDMLNATHDWDYMKQTIINSLDNAD